MKACFLLETSVETITAIGVTFRYQCLARIEAANLALWAYLGRVHLEVTHAHI